MFIIAVTCGMIETKDLVSYISFYPNVGYTHEKHYNSGSILLLVTEVSVNPLIILSFEAMCLAFIPDGWTTMLLITLDVAHEIWLYTQCAFMMKIFQNTFLYISAFSSKLNNNMKNASCICTKNEKSIEDSSRLNRVQN